jgi:hypothetical protein
MRQYSGQRKYSAPPAFRTTAPSAAHPQEDRDMRDDGQNPNRGGAMLPACKLYARTSGKGTSYLMGRLGGLRVLVMPKREAEAGDHTHTLLLAEAPQREGDR